MLVLSRRLNEIIRVGDLVTIEVVGISHDKVRLGITAPSDLSVHREEIYQTIQRELKQNGGDSTSAVKT